MQSNRKVTIVVLLTVAILAGIVFLGCPQPCDCAFVRTTHEVLS